MARAAIVAREFTILGLRGVVASGGAHLEPRARQVEGDDPVRGATIAMLRPDDNIAGAYLDEWGMVLAAARHRLVGDRLPAEVLRLAALRLVSRVFVTGGSGVIGGALVERLVGARGRRGGARALRRGRAEAPGPRRRGRARRRLDEEALLRGMEGAELAFHVAGVNKLCVEDPEPMRRVNVDGAVAAVRAASRAGVARLVHTSSAATLGEAPGTIGREDTPHRGWYLSTYERTKTEGERAVLATAREAGQDVVLVNPSSVQGPGRAGGTGRFLLAFLDGRMKVFVQTNVSLVDIADCVEGHLLAAERGQAGERYLLNGMTLTLTEALALAAEVAGVQRQPRLLPRPGGDRRRRRRRGRLPPRAPPAAGVPRDGPHAAARPPLRRRARRARARPALHRPKETVRRTVAGRARPACSSTSSAATRPRCGRPPRGGRASAARAR